MAEEQEDGDVTVQRDRWRRDGVHILCCLQRQTVAMRHQYSTRQQDTHTHTQHMHTRHKTSISYMDIYMQNILLTNNGGFRRAGDD